MAKKLSGVSTPPDESATRDPVAEMAATLTAPVDLVYIGPPATESPRYGALEPGRVYPEQDLTFAAYLLVRHPEFWMPGSK